jgi:hypothetical protein
MILGAMPCLVSTFSSMLVLAGSTMRFMLDVKMIVVSSSPSSFVRWWVKVHVLTVVRHFGFLEKLNFTFIVESLFPFSSALSLPFSPSGFPFPFPFHLPLPLAWLEFWLKVCFGPWYPRLRSFVDHPRPLPLSYLWDWPLKPLLWADPLFPFPRSRVELLR